MVAVADQSPRRRDYVVLQELGLRELLEILMPGFEMPATLADAVETFGPELYVKAQVVEQARTAKAAIKKAGHYMLRPPGYDPIVVPGIAVPKTQWTTEPVSLTPQLDVSVGW